MVIQQKGFHSFFKRKRDELNIENEVVGKNNLLSSGAPLIKVQVEHHGHEHEHEQVQPFEHHRQPIMFRGIEFLKRDLTLHPQICEYPRNQQNKV
jgi:hypothetical protein